MRRILEIYERQQHSLHVLFLDWSKAFDSVSFSTIESSPRFFGVPPLLLNAILSLYSFPKFRVRDAGKLSDAVAFVKVVLFLPICLTLFFHIYFMTLKPPTPLSSASSLE